MLQISPPKTFGNWKLIFLNSVSSNQVYLKDEKIKFVFSKTGSPILQEPGPFLKSRWRSFFLIIHGICPGFKIHHENKLYKSSLFDSRWEIYCSTAWQQQFDTSMSGNHHDALGLDYACMWLVNWEQAYINPWLIKSFNLRFFSDFLSERQKIIIKSRKFVLR